MFFSPSFFGQIQIIVIFICPVNKVVEHLDGDHLRSSQVILLWSFVRVVGAKLGWWLGHWICIIDII